MVGVQPGDVVQSFEMNSFFANSNLRLPDCSSVFRLSVFGFGRRSICGSKNPERAE